MKRILIFFIILCFWIACCNICFATWWFDAQTQAVTARKNAGGGVCSTPQDECLAAANSSYWVGSESNRKYISSSFLTTSTTPRCSQTVEIFSVTGTPTYTITVQLYSDNDGAPGSPVGTASDAVAVTGMLADQTITFANYNTGNLTDATLYHYVYTVNTPSTTNYISLKTTDGCSDDAIYSSEDGTTWTARSFTHIVNFQDYSE